MTEAQVNAKAFHYDRELNTFVAEASSLGWKPGYFPNTIVVDGAPVRKLEIVSEIDGDGEPGDVLYVRYGLAGNRPQFRVYND